MEEVILYISCQREKRETVQIHKQFENNLLEKLKKLLKCSLRDHFENKKYLIFSEVSNTGLS